MKSYDSKLSQEQLKRAEELYQSSIVVDMLFQGPIGTYSLPESLEEELKQQVEAKYPGDIKAQLSYASELIWKWSIYGQLKQLYQDCWYDSGITVGCRQLSVRTQDSLMRSMAAMQAEFDLKPWLKKVRTVAEIEQVHRDGLKAGIVTSQESLGYGKDLSLLEMAFDFGLRVQQLTYNNHNLIGAGCMEPNDAGLSIFGMDFVRKCNELAVVVDTGHCGYQTTIDACKHSNAPVVATHTGAERIFPHNRCKSDDEIKAIAATGGVIGVFTMPWFIATDPENTTIEHVIDHIQYVSELVGPEHVGIGSDWPMPQTKWMALEFKKHIAPSIGFAPGDGPSTEFIHGMKDYRSFGNLSAGLVARGFEDQAIIGILGGNWLRVFKQVFGA